MDLYKVTSGPIFSQTHLVTLGAVFNNMKFAPGVSLEVNLATGVNFDY
jgi:hypothetical protein